MHFRSPAQTLQSCIQAWLGQRDVEAALRCLADGVMWQSAGTRKPVRGKAAVRELLSAQPDGLPGGDVALHDLETCVLTDGCCAVHGHARVVNRNSGTSCEWLISAVCVRRENGFLIASLRMIETGAAKADDGANACAVSRADSVPAASKPAVGTLRANALEHGRLIAALKSVYPIALSVNLSRNAYRILGGAELLAYPAAEEGLYSEFFAACAALVHPDDRAEYARRFAPDAIFTRFVEGEHRVTLEFRQRSRDGLLHWVECVAVHAESDDDGDVLGTALCRFIDEQKSAEEALRQTLVATSDELSVERRYQQIVDDSIPVGTVIFRLDDGGTMLHFGGTMLGELGYTREEFAVFQENHLRGFVYEADYGTAFRDARMTPDGPAASFEQEYRVVKKDGSLVWMYEKGTLVQISDSGELGYISVFLDITRRKEIEDRLRISEEEMKLAMAQMGKMVSLYDVAARTLTMPAAYARKHGLPAVLPDVPVCFSQQTLLGDSGRAAFISFYEAILRGDKTGVSEAHLRCADGSWCWERAEFVTIFDGFSNPVKAIVAIEDTTLQHQRDDETALLRENALVFRMVATHSNRIIYRYDIATKTAYTDASATARSNARVIDVTVPDSIIEQSTILPESAADYRKAFVDIHAGKPDGSAKIHILLADGAAHWMDMRYSLAFSEEHAPKYAVISFLDITEDHEKELAYERYRQAIERNAASTGGLIFLEVDLTAGAVEKQGGDLLPPGFRAAGYSHAEAIDHIAEHYLSGEDHARFAAFFSREHLITLYSDGTHRLSEDWNVLSPRGGTRWIRSEIELIQDPYSGHIRMYTIMRDVNEEKLAALDVKKQAETDGMTGVYNKATTEALIARRLSSGSERPCALLIADLDSLKSVNDTHGHAQGDRAIRLLADTLKAHFRRTDIVGRVGGDEFIAFLDGACDEAKLRGTLAALIRRLSSLRIGEHNDVPLHGSIGVAFGTTGRDAFSELYRKADKALYHVKRNGKNDYALYTPEMDRAAYRYVGHDTRSVWQADAFDRADLDRLLSAISAVYALVVSVNLTKNSYYTLRANRFSLCARCDSGSFDELISEFSSSIHPDARAAFIDRFARENLLAAQAAGDAFAGDLFRRLGGDGVYRDMRIDVVFTRGGSNGAMGILLARPVEPEHDPPQT